MRILHLDPDDMGNPLSGGGPIRTYEICRRMAQRHEITVLTPTFEGSTPELHRDGVRYLRLGRKIGDHGSSHHITFLMSLPRAVRHFDHELLIEDFMPPASTTWTPIFRHRDRPLIASVQWFHARSYTRMLKLPFHWGEEFGVRMYDDFIVLSEEMKARISARHARANLRVIGNGVDDSLFAVPVQSGVGVLYLGRIEIGIKGIDLLLEAYARIPESEREELILAGNVQEPGPLQALIERLALQNWVRVVGPYDAAGRTRLLANCRFAVMPSRSETFGMTIAEANAAARQTIIWDLPPMNEVASPSTLRVPAFDVDAYAAAMRKLLAMPPAHLAMLGEASREYARRWDWDAVARAQEDFYLEVMDRHRNSKSRRFSRHA